MENSKLSDGAFCARLIPEDANRLNSLTVKAFEKSREGSGFIDARVVAVAYTIASLAISAIQVPVYAIRAILDLGIAILTLNATKQLQQSATDLLSSGKCLLLAAMTTFLVAASIVSPQWALSYYEPKEISEDETEKKLAHVAEIEAQLGSKTRELEDLKASLVQAEERVAHVAEIEAQLALKTRELDDLRASLAARVPEEGDAHVAEIEAQLVLKTRELEGLKASLAAQAEEREKHLRTDGLQVIAFFFNEVKYEIVVNRENPNSKVQLDRIENIIQRFKDEPAVVTTILERFSVETEDRGKEYCFIDLSENTKPNYVPDIAQMGGGSPNALESAKESFFTQITKSVWKEEHDPTKAQKYNAYMQEMCKQCERLFQPGWNDGALKDVEGPRNLLNKLMSDIGQLIMFDSQEGLHKDARERYQVFCARLDEACSILQNQDERKIYPSSEAAEAIINEIVIVRWMRVSLDGYLGGLVDYIREAHIEAQPAQGDAGPALDQPLGRGSDADFFHNGRYAERMCFINETEIGKAPSHVKKPTMALNWQKASGELFGENFTGGKNTPGLRSQDTWHNVKSADLGDQVVSYVRHGVPTAGSIGWGAVGAVSRGLGGVGDSGERVLPNYHQFLTALEKAGKAAFVTTHQQRGIRQAENTRVEAVRSLEKKHRNIAVLVQPIGQGNLGKKTGPYKDAKTFGELTNAIMENFFGGDEGDRVRCKLPDFVESIPNYTDLTLEIIQFVKETFFAEVDEFDTDQWQQFLLVFYTYQRFDLTFRFQENCALPVEYITTFCKDFLDRGGIVALVQASVSAMLTGRFDDDRWMEEQIRHTLGPPPLVKRQEMIVKKLDVFKTLYPRLRAIYRNPDKLAQMRGFRVAGKWQLTAHKVEIRPEQEHIQKIEDISTPAEMKSRLLWMQGAGRSKPTIIDAAALLTDLPQQGHEVVLSPDLEGGNTSLLYEGTPVEVNGRKVTLKEYLDSILDEDEGQEIKANLHRCFTLSQNGVSGPGIAEMESKIVRKDSRLNLGPEEDLSLVLTSTPEDPFIFNIEMRKERNYLLAGEPRQDGDHRYADVVDDTRFGRVQTALAVVFNSKTGDFTTEGAFKWWMKTVD